MQILNEASKFDLLYVALVDSQNLYGQFSYRPHFGVNLNEIWYKNKYVCILLLKDVGIWEKEKFLPLKNFHPLYVSVPIRTASVLETISRMHLYIPYMYLAPRTTGEIRIWNQFECEIHLRNYERCEMHVWNVTEWRAFIMLFSCLGALCAPG